VVRYVGLNNMPHHKSRVVRHSLNSFPLQFLVKHFHRNISKMIIIFVVVSINTTPLQAVELFWYFPITFSGNERKPEESYTKAGTWN
jgi:hypothetical protein